MLTWLLSPVDYVNGRFTDNGFDFYGVVPLAWALLAFAIGLLAGTVARRVIPAMAVTLAQFDQVQHTAALALHANPAARSDYLQQLDQWLQAHGYTQVLTYQPAGGSGRSRASRRPSASSWPSPLSPWPTASSCAASLKPRG
jgi:hypothetical protein